MNPFDGTIVSVHRQTRLLICFSGQAENASPRLYIPLDMAMRPTGLSQRRPRRLLHIIPHNTVYDSAVHSNTIYGLRITVKGDQPTERV